MRDSFNFSSRKSSALAQPSSIDTLDISSRFPHQSLPSNAIKDYRHACYFLYSYRGSTETFKSYRREIEWLLHWSWHAQTKSIRDLNRTDFEAFLEFCQDPPKHWIGIKHVARFIETAGQRIPNPE